MKLIKRSKTCLVLLTVLSFASTTAAAPGQYVQLEAGQTIPWSGWCFDSGAMAKLLSEKELEEERCQLKLNKSKEELHALHNLEIDKLRAEMIYEVKTRDATIAALKKENLKIEEAIIHEHKFGWIAPATLGAIVGALTAILVSASL